VACSGYDTGQVLGYQSSSRQASHLDVVRDEDGAAQTASDATDDVDDTDTQPAEQLFNVPHEHELKHHTQQ